MKTAIKIFSLSLMLIGGGTAFAQNKGYDKENMNLAVKRVSRFSRCMLCRF